MQGIYEVLSEERIDLNMWKDIDILNPNLKSPLPQQGAFLLNIYL
jgi:hypothetical protein